MNRHPNPEGTVFIGRVQGQEWPKGPKVQLFIQGRETPLATVELGSQWHGAVLQSVDQALDEWLKSDFDTSPSIDAELRARLEKLRDERAAQLPCYLRTFRFVDMVFMAGKPDEARFILTADKSDLAPAALRQFCVSLGAQGS